ncbi:hypothetical protein PM082_020327 [Marasmius tenuissimus]|nr:hypothetical protein PM082_020327 [Marasmius tenuissimus]
MTVMVYILIFSMLRVVRSFSPSLSSSIIYEQTASTSDPVTASDSVLTTTATTTFTVYTTQTVSSIPSSKSSYVSEPSIALSSWSMPLQVTNVAQDFKITKFVDSQQNLQIVNGLPERASSTSYAQLALPTAPSSPSLLIPIERTSNYQPWDNSSSAIQVFYPQGSTNPSSKPRGGAQFYASPIDLSTAKNVTFAYSVFFPIGFDFVKGGKLPGLYGGHSGCSGGDTALTCFSTRLMWRKDGIGELYLYAPKDQQTSELCSGPESVCDSTYGLSIGRGTFTYTPGKWTYVSQIVTLNTPGKQDGTFALDVNGERVIERDDIFYRDSTYPKEPRTLPRKKSGHHRMFRPPHPRPHPAVQPAIPKHHSSGGLLGLGGLLRRTQGDEGYLERAQGELFIHDEPTDKSAAAQQPWDAGALVADDFDLGVGTKPPSLATPEPPVAGPVGFAGIFFSTFFGGHEPGWASPRDQYVWFKDFSVIRNA